MVIINPIVIPFRELNETLREDLISEMLESFRCGREPFIENFVRTKVPHSEETGSSKSYFIIDQDRSDTRNICILAYYCLALKVMCITKEITGKDVQRLKLRNKTQKHVPTYYIAQLAKNDIYQDEIIGKDILDSAISSILKAVKFVGGRVVWAEAKRENSGVMQFYLNNGFTELQTEKQEDNKIYSHLVRIVKY